MKTIIEIKASFILAIKGVVTAAAQLTAPFAEAVAHFGGCKTTAKKKELRKTLIGWAVDAGMVKKTAANTISKLMKEAKIEIRKRGKAQPTAEQVAAAKVIVAFCAERYESDEIEAILKVAIEQAKETPDADEVAPAKKAA